MVYKWSVTLPKLTGSEPRNAYVYVPQACLDDPDLRCPVLYMFDGHNLFDDGDATYGKSWGLDEYLDFTETPLIVAAIECNHSPDNGRLSEYAPFDYDDPVCGPIHGRGKLTMDWMVKVFKPMVDRRFPTLPGRKYTFIGGSSMGGLMSLYALTKYNFAFSRAAILSPSLWTHPENIQRLIAGARLRPGTVAYMDYGSEEMANHTGMDRQFRAVTDQLLSKGVMLNSRIVPGGDHSEASWERQLPFFLSTLMYGL